MTVLPTLPPVGSSPSAALAVAQNDNKRALAAAAAAAAPGDDFVAPNQTAAKIAHFAVSLRMDSP